jgi:hypothetical protein
LKKVEGEKMAQRKAAVSSDCVKQLKVPDVVALQERVRSGHATPADQELLPRALAFMRGRYNRGQVSEKVAQRLGLLA